MPKIRVTYESGEPERTVEFSETDMAGIVHYSNFFRYMESAEHAFFRALGFSVVAVIQRLINSMRSCYYVLGK